MKKHLIYMACALVLIGLAVAPPAAAADGMRETGSAFEGSAHVNIATDFIPSICIQTLTNGEDADTPPGPSVPVGSTVTWTYVVMNTGNVALTGVSVTDDRGVTVTAPKTVLEPGESMTATASGTAQAGQYANVGTVTADSPAGPTVTASDPSHYFGVAPPVADFAANATDGLAPLAVQFADASAGTINTRFWHFGDGGTSTEQHPIHVYTVPGTYTVNLTVANDFGMDSKTKADYITVLPDLPPIGGDKGYFLVTTDPAGAEIYLEDIGATRYLVGNTSAGPLNVSIYLTATPMRKIIANLTGYHDAVFDIMQYPAKDGTVPVDLTLEPIAPPAPVANFTANPTDGIAPLPVQFNDTSTGDGITGRLWDFDDDGTVDSTEQEPTFTYTVPGIYTVNLTVTNAGGTDSEVKTDSISVLPDMPPVGGDKGYFLVSTVPPGADIYLEGFGGTRILQGNTSAGPLNVTLYLTAAPMRRIVAVLPGYLEAAREIGSYPAKGETVPVSLTLEPETGGPFPGPHVPATVIQAEDFDSGGEGVAYHDIEPVNLGRAYRPTEGVDIETVWGVTDVGWIRAGEYLTYSIDTTIAGSFTLTLRAANPDAAPKAVAVYLDGEPAGQVMIGGTGSWTTYGEFTGSAPMVISTGRHAVTLAFEGTNRVNLDWLRLAAGTVPTVTTTTPPGATFTAAPLTARYGSAVKFILTPKAGKTVKAAWWSFDAPAHLNTWNSRTVNPTFFYPRSGTFSPLVKITYTDGTTETVHRVNYVRAT